VGKYSLHRTRHPLFVSRRFAYHALRGNFVGWRWGVSCCVRGLRNAYFPLKILFCTVAAVTFLATAASAQKTNDVDVGALEQASFSITYKMTNILKYQDCVTPEQYAAFTAEVDKLDLQFFDAIRNAQSALQVAIERGDKKPTYTGVDPITYRDRHIADLKQRETNMLAALKTLSTHICIPPGTFGIITSGTSRYLGIHLGGGTFKLIGELKAEEKFDTTGVTTFTSTDRKDPLGAFFNVGYNFAPFSNNFVVGPFLSMSFINLPVNHTFAGGSYFGTTTHWFGTLGMKAGITTSSGLFIYGLAGGRVLNEDLNINFGGPVTSQNTTVGGFTAGLGIEYKPDNWQLFGMPLSVFAQYDHSWWANGHLNRPVSSPLFDYTFGRQDDRISVGINLYFSSPPPPRSPSKLITK
jgi:hypothetical protein